MRIDRLRRAAAGAAVLAVVAVAGCRTYRNNQQAARHKVILISFDGLSADEIPRRRDAGLFEDQGFVARQLAAKHFRRVIPVTPTLTAPTHISIATGTTPDHHGIVANRFHAANTERGESVRGFDAEITADTLWEAARRAGLKVRIDRLVDINRDLKARGVSIEHFYDY